MTQMGAGQLVVGPQLTPPSISLLSAALVLDELDERWVNGIHYVSEGCGDAEAFAFCSGSSKSISAAAPPITGTPYGVVAQMSCSTYTFKTTDYVARATRKLLAMESFIVARELWAGALAINPKLADPADTIIAGPESLITAIGTIEQKFMDLSPGVRCMIHMRPNILETLQVISGGMALRREGDRFYTNMDSIVSIDRGYPGTGPNGQAVTAADEWIYASPIVQVRHGAIMVVPTNMSEAVLRASNDVTFFAERAVHATWDYNCKTVALNVKRTS